MRLDTCYNVANPESKHQLSERSQVQRRTLYCIYVKGPEQANPWRWRAVTA